MTKKDLKMSHARKEIIKKYDNNLYKELFTHAKEYEKELKKIDKLHRHESN